ncbi:hypothetical protein CAEBREN_04961 [Caenorhabditis brenneri]|uniref:Sdz-33 F-box domain-containing protein n=1 Tax=Caenorhabditis brenneri TaxID=135651 RepID=G0P9X6_CAEBE|nr:hypothetical protein CAEBREN_04961 [Caenorhabditis brenneri]
MPTRNQTPDELKNLSLFQLIKYAIRSETCMEHVKSMTPKRPMKFIIECKSSWFTLRIFQGEQPEFSCILSEDVKIHADKMEKSSEKTKQMNFNGQPVLIKIDKDNHIYTYWDSPIKGLCFLLDYFSELFDSPPIYKFEITGSTVADRKKITTWIKNKRASKVEHIYVYMSVSVHLSTKELTSILGKVKPTAALDLLSKINADFRYKLPRNLKTFSCLSSNWLTKEDVMKMNYELIEINVEKFSYQDLSDFATKCIEGGLPALQHCFIEAKDLKRNFKIIADGIKYDRTWSKLDVRVERRKYTRFSYHVNGIYDYERADGKTVTICASEGRNKHCVLHLYVWTK